MNRTQTDQPRMVTIGIMGTPLTSGNRGVLALGAALARLCLNAAPSVKVALFGSHPEAGTFTMRPHGVPMAIPVIHWRMSPRSHPRDHLFTIVASSFLYRFVPIAGFRRWLAATVPWIGALVRTDLVGDVRGGDSFSDIYGLKRFLIATLPVLSVLWVKRSLIMFPQTYGPFKSRTSRWIAGWIIRNSTTIIARDRESQRIAKSLARPSQTVLLSPDVAFALHVDPMDFALFDGLSTPEQVPVDAVGLNVNGLMYNGGYTGKNMFGLKLEYRSFVTELATQILTAHSGPLLLIPHTYAPAGDPESDNDASGLLKESLPPAMRTRVRIVTGDYDAHQLKGIIGRCSFFVGSRMHSCIGALSQGVPCVGIAYSMKFRGVFESVGMEDWVIDGRTTDNSAAITATIALYRNRAVASHCLGERLPDAKARLKEIFAVTLQSQLS